MGNQVTCQECGPSDETLYKKQYGVISYSRKSLEIENCGYYCDITPKSEKDFEGLKEYWGVLTKLKTNVIQPMKIEIKKEEKLFSSLQQIRVWFPIEEYTLSEFATQNLKSNPLIPEIQLINIISFITDALLEFDTHNIHHGNISPDTILFDGKGVWLLSTPNYEHVNLELRMRNGKENLLFLLAPELLKARSDMNEFSKSDLYSLAVTVVHTIDRFSDSKTSSTLTQADIQSKINFLQQYYSPTFIDIISGIFVIEQRKRLSVKQLRQKLNKLIDLADNQF